MKIQKIGIKIVPIIAALAIPVSSVFAHVVVKPSEVGIGSWQTFVTGVPNEKDQPVTGLRLVIPSGVKHVSPNVKPGWTVDVKKEGTGEDAMVTEIAWKGGTIPAGQRDDFIFSAQAPTEEGELQWKAYQTYQDGTVVSWDHDPSEEHTDDESAPTGPYSVTKVKNDLKGSSDMQETPAVSSSQQSFPLTISIVALALSVIAIGIAKKK